LGDPTGSNATAGLALRVTGTHKPLYHGKVKIPTKGIKTIRIFKFFSNFSQYKIFHNIYYTKISLKYRTFNQNFFSLVNLLECKKKKKNM
jgi:hypothetical protein